MRDILVKVLNEYLFMVDKISEIKIDSKELASYKWIGIEEISNDINYGRVANKIKKVLLDRKK